MEIKGLRQKTSLELKKELAQLRDQLRELRFKVAKDETKDVRAARKIRKSIARILTIINGRSRAKANQH